MSWDRDWSVETWLEGLGLAVYTEAFLDNGYDPQELCANIKPEDLDAIGVENERHRTLIFAEAGRLREEARARFKKSKGGGSSGSTDHSGSMGSGGSFPAYSEPWGDEAQKHVYSEVWEQQQTSPIDAPSSGGVSPALAHLMQPNGGRGVSEKGHTFPPLGAVKPSRKKPPVSPISQASFTLPAAPRPPVAGTPGLNKLQLKLKVLEELQKDRIILSESPYCKEDGSMDEDKVSELCKVYSERFHIEPTQIMDTVRVIFKPSDPKLSMDEADGTQLLAKKPTLLSTSDAYEDPFDVRRDDLSAFKDGSPPSKARGAVGAPEHIYSEPVDQVSSPHKKNGQKKGGSPQFLQKPKPSSSESSPEQKRCGSPRASPQASPVTSPKEHKKFSFFSRKTKKAVRSNSLKEKNLVKTGGKAGKAVLTSGKSNDTGEGPAHAASSKKREARPSLSLPAHPSSSSPGHKKKRTVSMSSSSTTGSEPSPLPQKKIGFMRFSQRSPRPLRKAKVGHGGKDTMKASLSTSDMALDRVGLDAESEPEPEGEGLRGAQSHSDLADTAVTQESPGTAQKRKKIESKEKRGLLGLLRGKKKTVGKRGRKGSRGKEETTEPEFTQRNHDGPSFLTTSISMPNIASSIIHLEEQEIASSAPKTPQVIIEPTAAASKSFTAPPKPLRRGRSSHKPHSPDTSPLFQRKVQQSEGGPLGDCLIPIGTSGNTAEDGDRISSWTPVSPSHLIFDPPRVFESSSPTTQEQVSNFREPAQRESLSSCHSVTSADTAAEATERDAAGSLESHDSSVFSPSSTVTTSSATIHKTRDSSSLKKPAPPPKPKSLERRKTAGRKGSDSRPTSPDCAPVKEERRDNTNERGVPPQKPPRAHRGSVKQMPAERASGEESERVGEGASVVPPPKPARRHHSLKEEKDKVVAAEQRKSLTIQTPNRPVPKPRSSLSHEFGESSQLEAITAKLSDERIDLTRTPYSTSRGVWGVPALLVSRYSQELGHPPQDTALLMDEVRGQQLKKKSRDYKPVKVSETLKQSAIATDSIPNFLTSIGLPMYASTFTRSKGFFNVPSLRSLTEARLEELRIARDHRGILLEQLRHTK